MNTAIELHRRAAIHPFHAALLAGMVPLFLGALLADWAYHGSAQIQWTNFASWLLVGAMVLATIAVACALAGMRVIGGRGLVPFVLALAVWLCGFVDALVHTRDAWAVVPMGLALSAIASILAVVAAWMGFSSLRPASLRDAGATP